MTEHFSVKVYRYEDTLQHGEYVPASRDGWYISKVYDIKADDDGTHFLVYDDGSNSTKEKPHFNWICVIDDRNEASTMYDENYPNHQRPFVELFIEPCYMKGAL